DLVLKKVAGQLRRRMRSSDLVGRWGGEEFLAVMPHTDRDGAAVAALGWLRAVMALPMQAPSGAELRVSFSAGAAAWEAGRAAENVEAAAERLLHEADEQLYVAKDAGRACCAVDGRVLRAPQRAGIGRLNEA
ncbi:MAG: diguanylate cyclase, partial [Mariprofundaceae bacterium]